jgi:hypothetical protein
VCESKRQLILTFCLLINQQGKLFSNDEKANLMKLSAKPLQRETEVFLAVFEPFLQKSFEGV